MDPTLSDDDAVRAVNLAFYRAIEDADAEALAALVATTVPVSSIEPGRARIAGRQALVADCLAQATSAGRFGLHPQQTVVAGDVAWVILVEERAGGLAWSSEEGSRKVHRTHVFVREGDDWKIAHRQASPAPDDVLVGAGRAPSLH